MKAAVRFDRYLSMPTKPEMIMIPVVLNLLPPGGSAVIKEFECPENRNIGLILVTIPNTRDDSKISFFVLFHFEDVVDEFGEAVLYLVPKPRGVDKYEPMWRPGTWFGSAR